MNSKLFRTIAALAGGAALALPAVAVAHGDRGRGHDQDDSKPRVQWVTLVLKGKIASVDAGEKTSSLVVAVKTTNRPARRYRGKRIDVDIAPETRLRTKDHNGDGERDAADLAAGDRVVIKSRVPKGFAPPLESFRMLPN
jgi:hypothetical protein